MSTPTTAEVRKMVDDLDDIIRASVIRGDIESVFGKERKAVVRKSINLVETQLTNQNRIS
jgi:hypothetical protein